MPRRIRQSGTALRKLIRSLAATGVVAGSEAKDQVRLTRTTPQERRHGQTDWDRLLIGPASEQHQHSSARLLVPDFQSALPNHQAIKEPLTIFGECGGVRDRIIRG
jgi:hypothetical protein